MIFERFIRFLEEIYSVFGKDFLVFGEEKVVARNIATH